jgi:hypothetical protein
MQVTRGDAKSMPRPGRKKGFAPRPKQSVTPETETISHGSALKQSVTDPAETISHGRTETIGRNVDVKPEVDKPLVDGLDSPAPNGVVERDGRLVWEGE